MNPLTISINPKTVPDYQPSTGFESYLPKDNYVRWVAPVKLKSPPFQMATVMAHEVRNPLTNINLSIGMLEFAISDKDQKVYLDIIKRSAVRINDLLNELLKYQQADEMQADMLSIQQLLDEVVELAGDRIRLKNIAIRKNYVASDYRIVLNGSKMKIALTNIILNAIEAMTSGKGELKLATRSIGLRYVVEIEDNGCGISKANLKNIFKPYFTNKSGGLGLGLATTYDILRANRVGVNIHSEEGKGTRFILLFDKSPSEEA